MWRDALTNRRGKRGMENRMEAERKVGTTMDLQNDGAQEGLIRKCTGEEIGKDDWNLQTSRCGICRPVELYNQMETFMNKLRCVIGTTTLCSTNFNKNNIIDVTAII